MPGRSRFLAHSLVLLGSCSFLFACNALTGADEIEIGDEGSGSGSGAGSSSGSGAGSGSGTGAAGVGGGGVGGGEPQVTLSAAAGVNIEQIAVYQSVRASLMSGGAPVTPGVPVIAGKDALVRLFVSTDGNYDGSPVTARFTVEGQTPVETSVTVNGSPAEANLGSTVNFDVPGSMLTVGANYRVELLQSTEITGGVDNPGASFPGGGGYTSMGVQTAGNAVKVVLIPIAYAADGSNRLPDTSASQLQAYKDGFLSRYPVPVANITVSQSVTWEGALSSNGSGWDSLLGALADFRASQGAPADTYYYGIFQPTSSLGSFCGGGCVSGLGFVGSPSDSYTRAAIGLGYTGENSIETAVHELGHNHGRNHAPCGGAAGADPGFPYAGGGIGVWGYNPITGALINPSSAKDFMGYCDPNWISDYTYKALFFHIKAVNGANIVVPDELKNVEWHRAIVREDGTGEFLEPIQLETPPTFDVRPVEVVKEDGSVATIEARYAEFDHIEGGMVFWQSQVGVVDTVTLEADGHVISAIR